MDDIKKEVIDRLKKVERKGMVELIKHIDENGYFESPASTKYHGSYPGGLVDHSHSLYKLFSKLNDEFKLGVPEDTIVICSYFHDICKMGAYQRVHTGYQWNHQHPKGHSKLSVKILKKFIELTDQEESMILYHMGFYGTREFRDFTGEYTLNEMSNTYSRLKVCKLFYFCDDMSTNFLEDR